eukprot:6494248-Pyramimonas_sp.AAC.1
MVANFAVFTEQYTIWMHDFLKFLSYILGEPHAAQSSLLLHLEIFVRPLKCAVAINGWSVCCLGGHRGVHKWHAAWARPRSHHHRGILPPPRRIGGPRLAVALGAELPVAY